MNRIALISLALISAALVVAGCTTLNSNTINLSMFNNRSGQIQGGNGGTNSVANTTEGGQAVSLPISQSGPISGTSAGGATKPARPPSTNTNGLPRIVAI